MPSYRSTKTFGHEMGLSACFRQWRADSHCNLLHGYALSVQMVFEADTLDARNWVMDFGSFAQVKVWLATQFDHTLCVARDDPLKKELLWLGNIGAAHVLVLPAVGCEAFAEHIYYFVDEWLLGTKQAPRVRLVSVEVREHGANSAIYIGDRNEA